MKALSRVWGFVITLLLVGAAGCAPAAAPADAPTPVHDATPNLAPVTLGAGERLRVVATTTIVADVVKNIGGERIALSTLLPVGADPHAFEPTPRDVASISAAHVVFANGAGLEAFLDNLLRNAGEGVAVVDLSQGIELLESAEAESHHGEAEGEHHEGEAEGEHGHHHGGADPHIWFDPHNVMVWADTIAEALGALDPQGAETYRANAAAYKARLQELDAWIKGLVAQVPQENRRLVTDHTAFTYFAQRYGFEQVGAVFPGYSTLAEPSAADLAALETAIREQEVRAVFVGLTVNPSLAQRVAEDTGVQLVFLYTGSLSEPDGPAGDYLAMMRYNVSAIVAALR